ncbi:hypothetical protein TNCV_1477621 [Trichonephila clavipes]|nr:hypothetical protein TNCV_1477621 [Trichonephila clavipes]
MAKGQVTLAVICSFEHHTGDRTILARFHPNLEGEHSEGVQRPPAFLSYPPTSREDLQLDGHLEYPHAAQALYTFTNINVFSGI